MDVVAFVELALQVGDSDHNEEVLPDVRGAELEGFADGTWGAQLSARDFAILCEENSFAFERVEVLCEGTAEGAQIVAFNDEGEQRVDLVVGVEDSEEVSWMAMGSDGENVSD